MTTVLGPPAPPAGSPAPPAPLPPAPAEPRRALKPSSASPHVPAPAQKRARAMIEKGLTVHVLAGPFEGKVGVVQELDGKGGARVVLGTLSSWVPVTDLTHGVVGKERPPFRSSHRKPGR